MEITTRVIAGLGNPGHNYRGNRHNIGFMVVEALARRLEMTFGPPAGKYQAAIGRDDLGKIVLIKPLTYMNLSGEALVDWSAAAHVPLTAAGDLPVEDENQGVLAGQTQPTVSAVRPLVLCDDLALPLGSVRLRGRGSSGGQNGLASIIDELGGEDFPRMRLGIDGTDGVLQPEDWPDYVLADFLETEASVVEELIDHAVTALEHWLVQGLESTVSRFNRRIRSTPLPEQD